MVEEGWWWVGDMSTGWRYGWGWRCWDMCLGGVGLFVFMLVIRLKTEVEIFYDFSSNFPNKISQTS